MMQCEFCNIISGKAPAEIVFENEQSIAILDIKPIHYGHTLVIPRRHYETFLEVPDDVLFHCIKATNVVARAIVAATNAPGLNIFSNNGKAAGQSVFHFHFHVTPRFENDNIKFVLTLKKYSNDEMTEYANRLRRSIAHQHIQEIR
jgi:histidine triad (HIT) family protein